MKIISSLVVCAVVIGAGVLRSQMLSQQNRQSSPSTKVAASPLAQRQVSTQKRQTKQNFLDAPFLDFGETKEVYDAAVYENRFAELKEAAISRHGKMLAVVGRSFRGKTERRLRVQPVLFLVDARTGKRLRSIRTFSMRGLVFSPNGKWLITGGTKLRWWNVATGKLLREVPSGADALALSPNGKVLAVADHEKNRLDVWQTKPMKLRNRLGFQADPGSITFSPDGRQINSSTGLIYDVATRRMQRLPHNTSYSGCDTCSTWSPDGRLLSVLSIGQRVFISSTRLKRELWSESVDDFPANHVAFSPDSKRIVLLRLTSYGGQPSSILAQLYDARNGKILKTTVRSKASDLIEATSAVFSPDGKTVILAGTGLDNAIKIVHLTTK